MSSISTFGVLDGIDGVDHLFTGPALQVRLRGVEPQLAVLPYVLGLGRHAGRQEG